MVGRNAPCSCGSGQKFKKCCGSPERRQLRVSRPIEIPLGLHAESAQLEVPGLGKTPIRIVVENGFAADDPRSHAPGEGVSEAYKVVFTLLRPGFSPVRPSALSFESGLRGDSYLAIAPPALQTQTDNPPTSIRLESVTPERRLVFRGTPNESGFLAKLACDNISATTFADAQKQASKALTPFLSNLSLYFDVPLSIYQVDVMQLRTESVSITFPTPFPDVPLIAGPKEALEKEYRHYASLYREALVTNSSCYEFLCYYRIVEGIEKRRAQRIEKAKQKGEAILSQPRLIIPGTPGEQRAWLNSMYPLPRAWPDDTLATIFPAKTHGQKLARVVQNDLRPIRDRIAHAIVDSGEPTIVLDDGDDLETVEQWLPLARCIARGLLLAEFPDVFSQYTPTPAKGTDS